MSAVSVHKGTSAEYLSNALKNKSGGASLQIDSVTPIGTGQMAESYRVKFSQESDENIKSVVDSRKSETE